LVQIVLHVTLGKLRESIAFFLRENSVDMVRCSTVSMIRDRY
jgi:hypothetical protein